MNGSVISLIQENRKLFYKGILRNNYKEEFITNENTKTQNSFNNSNQSIKEKGFRLLQEFFTE